MTTIAWGPLATRDESQGSVTWLPPALAVASVVPPIDSVNVRVPAAAPSTQMSDHTTPLTVAPAGGLVMNTPSGGPLSTMRPRVAVPTWPAASRTVATIVWGPLATRDESQGSVTWLPLALAVASVVPPIDSVNVRVPAAAPSTQMSDHTTPPTVAPAGGLVMNTGAR